MGFEKLHPFDSCKYGRIVDMLVNTGSITHDQIVAPNILSDEELAMSHTADYLASLKSSSAIASVSEMPFLSWVPTFILNRLVLNPFRYASRGTIDAAHAALAHGYAINLGGGFHHASRDGGHGFCFFNDISMAVWSVRQSRPDIRVMILDLDAHQGDGHEKDFKGDPNVHIMDCLTPNIFPNDADAREAIGTYMEFDTNDDGWQFIAELEKKFRKAVKTFKPDLVIYNAGSDILDGDPLSGLSIRTEHVIKRDEIVFNRCLKYNIPIAMLLSGGYQRETADVIANSIQNLHSKFGILTPKD